MNTIETLNEYSDFSINDVKREIVKYKTALQLYQERKIEKAIHILQSAKSKESKIFLGYIFSKQKEYAHAIEILSEVLNQMPYSFELKITLIQQYILNE